MDRDGSGEIDFQEFFVVLTAHREGKRSPGSRAGASPSPIAVTRAAGGERITSPELANRVSGSPQAASPLRAHRLDKLKRPGANSPLLAYRQPSHETPTVHRVPSRESPVAVPRSVLRASPTAYKRQQDQDAGAGVRHRNPLAGQGKLLPDWHAGATLCAPSRFALCAEPSAESMAALDLLSFDLP